MIKKNMIGFGETAPLAVFSFRTYHFACTLYPARDKLGDVGCGFKGQIDIIESVGR